MPLYDLQCEVCDEIFEEIASIGERENILCPECSGDTKILLSPPRGFSNFIEGIYDIGEKEVRCNTRRQLKEAMKIHNEECGDDMKTSYSRYLEEGYGY